MKPSYELFDHTADMGVRVRAASLPELVAPAVEALYAVTGEVVTEPHAAESRIFDLAGHDPADLLRELLAELLFILELEGRVAVGFEVACFTPTRLRVAAKMMLVDRRRSVYHREVKAVTYHELGIRPIDGGYEAVYVVDI